MDLCTGCRLDRICQFYGKFVDRELNTDVFEIICKYKEVRNDLGDTVDDGEVEHIAVDRGSSSESGCVDSGDNSRRSEEFDKTMSFDDKCKVLWCNGRSPAEMAEKLGVGVTKIYPKLKNFREEIAAAYKKELPDGTFKTAEQIAEELNLTSKTVREILEKKGLLK